MILLLLVHAAATWFMTGLIWFVQVVHYPLFEQVGATGSAAYARAHAHRTTRVVGPLMLVELLTAAILAMAAPPGTARLLAVAGLVLLMAIWLSTVLVQVPCHRRLSAGPDPAVLRRLISSNWMRTLLWSMRGMLAAIMLRTVPA